MESLQQRDHLRHVNNQRTNGFKQQIPIEHKLKIIELHNRGVKTKEICETFNITEGAVRYIKKNQDKIKQFAEKYPHLALHQRKKIKGPHYIQLEEHLMTWFDAVRSLGHPVSEPLLKEKAMELNRDLGGPVDFKASNGWLEKCKKRYGIGQIQEDKSSADFQATEDLQKKFSSYLQEHGYKIENVYKAEETGINWRNVSRKTLDSEFDGSCSGIEGSKDCIDTLVCANACGTHPLPLLIIGKYSKLQCVKKKSDSQKSGWMNCEIFMDWYKNYFIPHVKHRQELDKIDGKVLLILDNAPSHPKIEELNAVDENFQVLYLPKIVTSLIQPMDQDVIETMKKNLQKDLLRNVLNNVEQFPKPNQFLKNFNLRESCDLLTAAFGSSTNDNLKNARRKVISQKSLSRNMESRNELLLDTQERFRQIPGNFTRTYLLLL